MSHPITDQIANVRKVARRLAIARASGAVVAVLVAVFFLVATCDYWLRLEDPGTRVLLTLVWLAVTGAAAWNWLLPICRTTWSDQSVALLIEKRFPLLAGKLSSSLAFLTQADESFGSKTLMRNVVAETTTSVSQIDLNDAIDYRPTAKTLGCAVVAILTGLAICVFDPGTSSQAVSRLLLPLQDNPWPRVNHLKFIDPPTSIARGGDVKITLEDESGNLPPHVDIQLWQDGQSEKEADTISMQRIDDQMVLKRNNVTRSFRYRASGGDDRAMKWVELKVVEPPRVVSGEMKLTPPKYTGWQLMAISEPFGSLRVLDGTGVQLSGTADRALASGLLLSHVGEDTHEFAAAISKDGRSYSVPSGELQTETWQLQQTQDYTLTLVDRSGTKTVDPDQWNVRIIHDEPPALRYLESAIEELVTPQAVVPIRCDVEDDLATKLIGLRYLRTDQSEQGESATMLFEGVASLPSVPMPETIPPPADKRTIDFDWALEPLKLTPGIVVSYYVFAEDYKSQSNQTLARRLVVVSENDLIDRAGRRQSLVLSRLQQRLMQQRQAKQLVDTVKLQLGETQRIEKSTMDRLQSALLAQRQVNTALQGEDAELIKELTRLKMLLDRSRIGEVDVRARVERTLVSVTTLGKKHLDPAVRHGTSAQQSLQVMRDLGHDEIPADVPRDLQATVDNQSAAITWLEELLDDMSAWDNFRRFAQELNDILRQQRDVRRATEQVTKDTLSRNQQQLDGKQRAGVRAAAARQLELARRMDRTLVNLSKANQELQESDPQAAQLIDDAMQAARDSAVSGLMRQAGRQIDQNRLGLAAQQQETAEQALEDMLDGLSRRSYSPEQRVEKLVEAGRELQRLRKRQAELSKEFQKSSRERDTQRRRRELQRLTKRQKQLAQDARKTQRQLQRQGANDSSQQTGQASSSMDKAASAAEQGDSERAQQQSQLAEAKIEQAQQSLQQEQEKAKSQLAQEQLVRLPQLIEALISQQASVLEEVKRLEQIRTERGELTSSQQASVEVAAEAERTVAQDTGMVASQMSQLPAFVFALSEAQRMMGEVADSLDGLHTSDRVQQLASRVLDELNLIHEMMKSEQQSQKQQQSGGGGGSNGQSGNQPSFDPQLAQFKLLRGMQIEINKETKQLNRIQAADGDARVAQEQRQLVLADRQGELARIVRQMSQPPAVPAAKRQLPRDQDQLPNLDALDRELEELLK